jgi:predicted RNase H-like HicB family nuclease
MTEFKDLKIWTQTNGKVWAAATGKSPYFCFVASTQEAALAEAKKALKFYCSAPTRGEEQRLAREAEAQKFELKENVQAKELAPA